VLQILAAQVFCVLVVVLTMMSTSLRCAFTVVSRGLSVSC